MLSFNTTSSNRIAVDVETNEAFPDRKTNPEDFDKLEGCNPKRPRICSPMSQARSTRGQENEVQTLTTKDCKGPQTNMPENVGSMLKT